MAPQRANLVLACSGHGDGGPAARRPCPQALEIPGQRLTSYVPYSEGDVPMPNSLDVEPCVLNGDETTARELVHFTLRSAQDQETPPIVGMVVTTSPSLSLYKTAIAMNDVSQLVAGKRRASSTHSLSFRQRRGLPSTLAFLACSQKVWRRRPPFHETGTRRWLEVMQASCSSRTMRKEVVSCWEQFKKQERQAFFLCFRLT